MMPFVFQLGPGSVVTLRQRLSRQPSGYRRNGGVPCESSVDLMPGTRLVVTEVVSEPGFECVRVEDPHGRPNQFLTVRGADVPNLLEFMPASTPQRFTTDKRLFDMSNDVALQPARDHAVFWAYREGRQMAQAFVAANPGFTRIEDLLAQTDLGFRLLRHIDLQRSNRRWSDVEEIWLNLSIRLAQAASGIVNAFVPKHIRKGGPVEDFKHPLSGAYADSQFEKVELIELESFNLNVTDIYINGRLYNG